ncbi:hypothetical protein [Plantactinospora sp. GCM10030261]|uniref:hypothetical protein n=1 Tax=Plantactinospora sp. GCM10030261 TaxID=3273420 RepID=UPI00361B73CA
MRARLRHAVEHARASLARLVLGTEPEADPDRVRAEGTLSYALISGLIVQWLVDPESLPDAESLPADLLLR